MKGGVFEYIKYTGERKQGNVTGAMSYLSKVEERRFNRRACIAIGILAMIGISYLIIK